jgi:hypothetical protein
VSGRGFTPGSISDYISKHNLEIPDTEDLDENIITINAFLTNLMDTLAPERVIRTTRPCDMANVKIEAAKKRRDRLLKQCKANPSDQKALQKLKTADRDVRRLIKEEER